MPALSTTSISIGPAPVTRRFSITWHGDDDTLHVANVTVETTGEMDTFPTSIATHIIDGAIEHLTNTSTFGTYRYTDLDQEGGAL